MRLLPLAQLLRLPNVFTAFADILLGALAAATITTRPVGSLLLMASSGCLYCSGMVWNDWFDLEVDRKERPFRPLPSGKITPRHALMLAIGLLAVGIVLAGLAGWSTGGWTAMPLMIASILAGAVLLYDGALKATPIGPVSMGACRLINVLLGLSLADSNTLPWDQRWHVALVVGTYISGVTWFARGEADRSNPRHLRAAALVILSAVLLALAVPVHRPAGEVTVLFPYLLAAFLFLIGMPIVAAIRSPGPGNVQAAIKRCIMGLVVLDAVLATAYVGWQGLLLVLLLAPAILLGRRVYST